MEDEQKRISRELDGKEAYQAVIDLVGNCPPALLRRLFPVDDHPGKKEYSLPLTDGFTITLHDSKRGREGRLTRLVVDDSEEKGQTRLVELGGEIPKGFIDSLVAYATRIKRECDEISGI